MYEHILSGEVDFGISSAHRVPEGLVVEPLFRETVVLALAVDHPLRRQWPNGVPRAALAQLPFIAL